MANILKLIERHCEKGLLALAALFMVYVFVVYFIFAPNAVEFAGKKTTPGELNSEILAKAKNLESAVQRADQNQKDAAPVVDYGKQLREKHQAGIFAAGEADAPALPPTLRLATTIGKSINVPGLEETEETGGNIQLATPLPPHTPVVETGRSLLVAAPMKLMPDQPGTPAPAPTTTPPTEMKPMEKAWVTIAAYFDKRAQYNEHVKAKYAPFRTNVYVAAVEVERQEMGADGSFGDKWERVKPGKLMPEVTIPDAVIDDESGTVKNRDAVDKAFKLLQREQDLMMQPPFPNVSAGDPWETPPLEGFAKADEPMEEKPVAKAPKPAEREETSVGRAPPQRGGTGRNPGRGGGGGEGGQGRIAPRGQNNDAELKEENRRAARVDLDMAKKEYREKHYPAARELAQRVSQNPEANVAQKKEADDLVKKSDDAIAKETGAGGGGRVARGGEGTGFISRGGEGVLTGRGGGPTAVVEQKLIKNPESGEPAVWFHDDTVEAGKTYRYRMRVLLWNRYVGKIKALSDPAKAKLATVAGEWSQPTDPITVAPATHFFAKSPKVGTSLAMLDVFKWDAGKWLRQTFEAGPGDLVGGLKKIRTDETDDKGRAVQKDVDFSTDAVVLDVRPKETVRVRLPAKEGYTVREQDSLVIVYLDPADGQVKERVQAFDRSDPLRRKIDSTP